MSIKSDKREIVYESIGEVKNNFRKPDDPKKIRNSKSQLILKEKYLPALEGNGTLQVSARSPTTSTGRPATARGCILWGT